MFSGTGGLDRGFENEGFKVIWANEYDKSIWSTFEANFPHTTLDRRSIVDINPNEAPKCDGLIGGPPCQSWSEAGAARGINDPRGQLFNDYVKFIKAKKPRFFLAENVQGLLFSKHSDALDNIFKEFLKVGYNVSYHLLNSNNYGVPQDRKRVIIVGYPVSYGEHFIPPEPDEYKPTLKDAIWDLRKNAKPALKKNNFELHIRASGPLGAFVYKHTNGLLEWKQRRSYAFVSKPVKPVWIEEKF